MMAEIIAGMPRVSVIVPTYNGAKYLPGALESVFAQTYSDFEVVVVNDGSTDNTEEALAPYRDRIVYLRQENRGISAARNAGIRASSGEIIALLDDDDEWFPVKLAMQVPCFDDAEVGLVYSDFATIFDDGTESSSYLASRPLAQGGWIFANFLQSGFILPTATALRRFCLDQVGMFDETMRHLEDFELWFRVLWHWKAAVVRQPLALRRMRAGNMTSDRDAATQNYVILFERILATYDLSPELRRIAKRQTANFNFHRGYFLLRRNRAAEARPYYRRAIRLAPWNRGNWKGLAASYLPRFSEPAGPSGVSGSPGEDA